VKIHNAKFKLTSVSPVIDFRGQSFFKVFYIRNRFDDLLEFVTAGYYVMKVGCSYQLMTKVRRGHGLAHCKRTIAYFLSTRFAVRSATASFSD
jgi:hypothetical protein